MKNMYIYLLALVIAVAFMLPLVAHGEATEVPVIKVLYAGDYVVEPIVVDGEALLEICFNHNEQELSFYWEGELDTGRDLWVQIRNGNVEGGGYVE